MSLFDLQDVCIAIGSLATLDLPMVVDLIGIYGLKGPYRTLTTTDWFLQALSVIPRESWGNVARRFTMIRWAGLLVQPDEGVSDLVVDRIGVNYRNLPRRAGFLKHRLEPGTSASEKEIILAITLDFKASNNEAEYEALLIGLRAANKMGIARVVLYSDSQLVIQQSNGQVEVTNQTIVQALKARLDSARGRWMDELPSVLWAYRTTTRAATGETPYCVVYGTEALLPAEIEQDSLWVMEYSEDNGDIRGLELDHLEERRARAAIRLSTYHRRMEQAYNKRV
ncbi:hypothetical protein F511_15454 [Dorcoceras hygrometricum]|uniref:RNase H type-1 domain-containing protein n=1 Tax=Dorcoceras hygrometricum TaxID=472368 RepID=A0A2Z7CXX2_9LAMI|nr:hypothetical protein F511_15454 [Dorcoceras hygrometricum]